VYHIETPGAKCSDENNNLIFSKQKTSDVVTKNLMAKHLTFIVSYEFVDTSKSSRAKKRNQFWVSGMQIAIQCNDNIPIECF